MSEFDSIQEVALEIKKKLDSSTTKKKIIALYAFNATGKTRLANMLDDVGDENYSFKALCYSAFFEDMFKWDNENYILTFNSSSWIMILIINQGLESNIINNFKNIVDSKIEPFFDFYQGRVTFNFASGDDRAETNVKISRGEESMLIWSIFYTILEAAIDTLNTEESNRTTEIFNNLQYIIIDDPVSSIDDTRIITMAVRLINSIRSCKNNSVKFLITTHHALFYNVLVNSFKDEKTSGVFEPLRLSKDNYKLQLTKQNDSPFSYHLSIKELIQNVIDDNSIEKYHFNLFRNLLEKTSNFLGYSNWRDCLPENNRKEFERTLNLYSHSKLSDLESRELPSEDKDLFRVTFTDFIKRFDWNN